MNTLAIDVVIPTAESVIVTNDTLTVELSDGEASQFLSLGSRDWCMQPQPNAELGGSLDEVEGSIGTSWTRT